MTTDKLRREAVASSVLPYYLGRFRAGPGSLEETKARIAAFETADRVIAESDSKERDGV